MVFLNELVRVRCDRASEKRQCNNKKLLPRCVAHRLCVFSKNEDLEGADAQDTTQNRVKGVVANVRHGVFYKVGRVVAGLGRRCFDGVQTLWFPRR